MSIRVDVRFLGIFQRLTGKKRCELTLKEPATVKDVVTKLLDEFPDELKTVMVDPQLDDPRPNSLILVEGKEVSALQGLETEVKDSQEIVFLPMVHGG